MLQRDVNSAFQLVALINACYSGEFLRIGALPTSSYGNTMKGAHVIITAGGAQEPTWHDDKIGSGSVFFEQIYSILANPSVSDDYITIDQLWGELKKRVTFATNEQQTPRLGDLIPGGSPGGYNFINRAKLSSTSDKDWTVVQGSPVAAFDKNAAVGKENGKKSIRSSG
jgi:hypothetical protein